VYAGNPADAHTVHAATVAAKGVGMKVKTVMADRAVATSTSFVILSPTIALSFSLSYPTRVRFSLFANAKQTVAGKLGYVRLNLVGVATTGNLEFGGGPSNNAEDITNGYGELFCSPGGSIGTLAAGSYTAQMEASTDSGGTLFVVGGYIAAFVMSPVAF